MSLFEEHMVSGEPTGIAPVKRARTAWDVDVSLEKLVSWDVLEQFMQEFPDENSLLGSEPGGDESDLSDASASALAAAAASRSATAASAGALGSAASAMCAFSNIPLDSPFMCPPWPPGGMPDFFGGSMHSFQMPPQLFGGMSSAQFFAQQPPPSFFAQPPSGALGAGFLHSADAGEGGASPSAGNDDADADSTGAAGFAARKGKAPKRARTSAAKGIGGAPEPAEAVSGGGMRRVGSIDSGLGGEDADDDWQGADGDKKATHKQRFVWTADLHRRFEIAVNSLGIEHAKPQAISQLMNIEGCHAPTRQNIKSHLQKYRLLLQKRSRNAATVGGMPAGPVGPPSDKGGGVFGGGGGALASAAQPAVAASAPTPAACAHAAAASNAATSLAEGVSEGEGAAAAAASAAASTTAAAAAADGAAIAVAAAATVVSIPGESPVEAEGRLKQQELNLKVQLQLQAKLHRHLLMQRQLQHQLEVICYGKVATAEKEFIDTPRGQATLALRNDLRSQLSKAVSMQQEMLQHLDSLVRADGPAVGSLDDAPSVKAEEAEAAAVVDTLFAESEFDHSYVGAHAAPPHTNGALGHADGATAKSTGGAS